MRVIKWGGRRSLTWTNGRSLASIGGTSFTYDADGLRVTKASSGKSSTYYALNGKYVGEKTVINGTTYYISYYYDENGAPMGINVNGSAYFFVKNLQGDITAIMSYTGTVVAKYTYDAWGKLLSVRDGNNQAVTSPTHIANLNPFRYRGYIYDTETELYYVSSRYYDPEIGRWINADNQIAGVGGEILGYNMFAYCMNNPVNMSDPSGNWPEWATKLVAAVAVVAVVAVVAAVTVATAGAGTAIAAVAVGAAKGAAVGFVAGAASGAAGGAISHRISTGSWSGAGEAALNGMADGALSGAITGAITGGIQGGISHASTSVSTNSSQVDPRIEEALRTLDKTGIKPGQTQISQKRVLELYNSYNPLKASSSYTNINGTLHVSEGHHTMIANVMKYGKLNSGMNMGQMVYDPNVVTNMLWTTLEILL